MGNIRKNRRLKVEMLEERQLLAVTGAEYDSIRVAYPDFALPTSQTAVNIIEIQAASLTCANLKSAISQAALASSNDLIVIRTTSTQNTITFSTSADELLFNFDSQTAGKISIVALGTSPLTLNAASKSRVMTINAKVEICLGNLVLTDGFTNSGKIKIDPEFVDITFGAGGAILNKGSLTMSNVTLTKNSVSSLLDHYNFGFSAVGGAVCNEGYLFATGCSFTENTTNPGEPNRYGRAAGAAGGAIFNDVNATLVLSNSTVTSNTAKYDVVTVTIETEDEHGNKTYETISVERFGYGGGLYNYGGKVTINTTTFSGNKAAHGGAVYNLLYHDDNNKIVGRLEINRSTFSGNSVKYNGGAIANESLIQISNSVLSGNTAGQFGGAVFVGSTYKSGVSVYNNTLTNCTITGNQSGNATLKGAGGGIYFVGTDGANTVAELTLFNSIVVQNRVNNAVSAANDVNIVKTGTIKGYYNLSTFTAWNTGVSNSVYNSAIELFVKNYDFAASKEGDYQLVNSGSSQAVNCGNNAYAVGSLDRSGSVRISGQSIDLGAYEYFFQKLTLATPGLSAILIGDRCVAIDISRINQATSYRLTYSTSSNFAASQTITLTNSGVFNLSSLSLTPGANWYFRVVAVANDFFDSAPSATLAVKTQDNTERFNISADKTTFSLQQGCGVNVNLSSAQSNITYHWDLNGDGVIDYVGQSLWLDSGKLKFNESNVSTVVIYGKDSLGKTSNPLFLTVNAITVSPTIQLAKTEYLNGQMLLLNLDAIGSSAGIVKWSINWGDSSVNSSLYMMSASVKDIHFYTKGTNAANYAISLTLTYANGREETFSLGNHYVAGTSSAAALPEKALLPENNLPVALSDSKQDEIDIAGQPAMTSSAVTPSVTTTLIVDFVSDIDTVSDSLTSSLDSISRQTDTAITGTSGAWNVAPRFQFGNKNRNRRQLVDESFSNWHRNELEAQIAWESLLFSESEELSRTTH